MGRAIIFDFDGVVADSEPIHLAVFQRVLGEIGLFLSKDEYYASYLGYDDKGCFSAVLAAHGQSPSVAVIEDLVARKARVFLDHLKEHLIVYPGIRELVREAAPRYRLAIASGALRDEIEFVLEHAGIRKEFEHITSAEDVVHGKPNPEAFLHALASLNRSVPARSVPAPSLPAEHGPLQPEDCLAIEDSRPGIRAARVAGMKVLAVANTHPLEELDEADVAVTSLSDVKLDDLERRLWGSG